MTDPITFDSTSPRFGLPLLFSGQVQKEVYLNEALSRLDGLTHCGRSRDQHPSRNSLRGTGLADRHVGFGRLDRQNRTTGFAASRPVALCSSPRGNAGAQSCFGPGHPPDRRALAGSCHASGRYRRLSGGHRGASGAGFARQRTQTSRYFRNVRGTLRGIARFPPR